MDPNEQQSSKKWLWVGLGVFFVLLILGGLWYLFGRSGTTGSTTGKWLPFGSPTQNIPQGGQDTTGGTPGNGQSGNGGESEGGKEPMFRQLTSVPVAGAYTFKQDGVEYVRYIEKATGHAYEVGVRDGVSRQLTNTTIPRIALADWTLGGNAVVLRYLEQNTVKTHLGRLNLPSASSSIGQVGTLTFEFLPDNIAALSVAPDGKDLFYLVKTASGVAGSIVNFGTRTTREVFRSTFSEWLPQLLNDDTVILTTKPSGNIVGYSYHYDPKTGMLERLVREKNGLTTLGTGSGSRILYGENVTGNSTLGVHNKSGFSGDEGTVFYDKTLSLATLPEKCAWLSDGIRAVCGSFVNTPSGLIPDLWYQGVLSFADTFWSVNTDTDEIAYLADPKTETGQEFDVTSPLISANEDYFVFTNKKDGTLWSMRIPESEIPADTSAMIPANLSPAELQDAQGSLPESKVRP